MMQGRLIVLEGIDGSGKSTQYEKLCKRLEEEGRELKKISFPRYEEESSALVRQYLRGDFGKKPGDVNAYAASAFYAVDRYASYKTDWKDFYENGGLILAARYTTSNACHQASKLSPQERGVYLEWLYDFEFRLMGLPAPSLVIYLDVDIDTSERQMRRREDETDTKADIHETDTEYLMKSIEAGRFAAEHYGWKRISCIRDGEMRSIDDIHEEIYSLVTEVI